MNSRHSVFHLRDELIQQQSSWFSHIHLILLKDFFAFLPFPLAFTWISGHDLIIAPVAFQVKVTAPGLNFAFCGIVKNFCSSNFYALLFYFFASVSPFYWCNKICGDGCLPVLGCRKYWYFFSGRICFFGLYLLSVCSTIGIAYFDWITVCPLAYPFLCMQDNLQVK